MRTVIYDLHMHSNASDGALPPDDLLELARARSVDVASITDHDTVAAYDRIDTATHTPLRIVPGIELSTTWRGRSIHVVGLDIDPVSKAMKEAARFQQTARRDRAREIGARLDKLGAVNSLESALEIADGAVIGRPHFAAHLVQSGIVKDARAAFRKYLGAGKPGDVRCGWPGLEQVITWIRDAGGSAVLAHPAKYGFTTTKLRALLSDFVTLGGAGIEVVCGRQDAALTRRMATLAQDFGLLASTGSDFHRPGHAWSQPGLFDPLPAGVTGIWERWTTICA